MSTYTAVFERDEDGWWVATVRGVQGCHTQGRTIDQARKRLQEALAAALDEDGPFEFREQIRLPREARELLTLRRTAQRRLEESQARSQALTRQAVKTLVRDLDLSVRDAGALLGLSHQRVQQLVQEEPG